MKRIVALGLGKLAASAGTTVYMGWLGADDIPHRAFDAAGFLISAAVLIAISFRSGNTAGL